MTRILLILILQSFALYRGYSQSFTIDNLLTLPSLPSNNVERFMNKIGYSPHKARLDDNLIMTSYFEKETKKKDTITKRTVDLYKKDDTWYFALRTNSLNEYLDGQKQIIKAGFAYDNKKDTSKPTSIFFQKKNITIEAICGSGGDTTEYTFFCYRRKNFLILLQYNLQRI